MFVRCRKSRCSWYMHRVPPNGPTRIIWPLGTPDILSLSLFLFLSSPVSLFLSSPRYIRTASDWPWTYRRRRLRIRTQPSPFPRASPSGALGMHRRGRRNAIDSVILFREIERISSYLAAAQAAALSRGETCSIGFCSAILRFALARQRSPGKKANRRSLTSEEDDRFFVIIF